MTRNLAHLFLLQFCLVLFCTTGHSQIDPTDDASRLKTLNSEVVESFRAGKLDDAIKASKLVVELTTKLFGSDHVETAVAHSNLGELYSYKQKEESAFASFQEAWQIYRKAEFKSWDSAGKVLIRLAQLTPVGDKGEPFRLEIEDLMESAESGNRSAKSVYPFVLSSLTLIYARQKQFDKADDLFLKRYAEFKKLTPQNITAFEGLEDDSLRFEAMMANREAAAKRRKEFNAKLRLQVGEDLVFGDVFYRARVSEVEVGKALHLPKPEIPHQARLVRASGTVGVRVLIDKYGSVIEAKAISGHPFLRETCEIAAKGAKYAETKLAGKPMKVRGLLTYNFVQ